MAGEGSRFKNCGIDTPKPLLKLYDKELYRRALNSISLITPVKYSFIIRQEHIDSVSFDKILLDQFPTANIVSVFKTTKGALETCMLVENYIKDDDAIILLDCDLEFKCNYFIKYLKEQLKTNVKDLTDTGALITFKSKDPRYSFAKGESNRVIEVAEKNPISNNAIAGAYFINRGKDFKEMALKTMKGGVTEKEFYISTLFNSFLKENKTIRMFFVDEFHSYGTPEELDYERVKLDKLQTNNK